MSETPRTRRRRLPALVLALLGVAAATGGTIAIVADLKREPTSKEIKQAGAKEIATRWQNLKVAAIFPPTLDVTVSVVNYSAVTTVDPLQAIRRAAVAPPAGCAEAFDRKIADILVKHGCRTALRATYVDASGTMATTLGIAVMPGTDAATRADTAIGAEDEKAGVRTLPVRGTVAAGFGDGNRRQFHETGNDTPYLFFRSSGWLVARDRVKSAHMAETFQFADTALGRVMRNFGDTEAPCRRQEVQC
ncbi:hypothetical protein SMC26_02945 [Actinomadura fulvescens]|uniref:PknH-like extracellular domain-containing protein n=1 Tax=Actinomadura fulvescens TaxID=46160 RepID=A0ABN3PU27_9ACTN